jgi:acyl-CoA synthetase (AMP-forming)/AMP-acid ligase II
MNFGSILRRSCVMFRDNVAVTCGDRQQTYAELGERACRLANALAELGLEPGDRVAVLADNQLETFEQAAAIAAAGLVRAPMYVTNTASTHACMLNLVGARACIVAGKYAADIEKVRDDVPSLQHVIVLDGATGGADELDYEALLAAASPEFPDVVVPPEADHIIRFSAGTTGFPKGIVHSCEGWLAMGNEFSLALPRLTENDAYLVGSPLSHAAGLMIWPFLARGARYVVMPHFEPAGFLELIERERCTMALVVPTMIQMLAGVPGAKDRDLSSLRAVTYGAAPITEKDLRAGIELWGNIMYQSYGQSEALPATTLTPEYHRRGGSARDRRMLTSAGRPNPNVIITIRDEQDGILPDGDVGEICVNTPGAMKAIWRDPEATAARFTADGSVRTRDMGYLDDVGFLHLVDRKEDLIISGGFNVWPLEVENALAAHPDVAEAAVVGVPDEKWGEAVFAVVTLYEGSSATAEELIAFAREKVGPVKRPKQLVIAQQALPKSVVGKLLRRQVRAIYWSDGEKGHT